MRSRKFSNIYKTFIYFLPNILGIFIYISARRRRAAENLGFWSDFKGFFNILENILENLKYIVLFYIYFRLADFRRSRKSQIYMKAVITKTCTCWDVNPYIFIKWFCDLVDCCRLFGPPWGHARQCFSASWRMHAVVPRLSGHFTRAQRPTVKWSTWKHAKQ